MSARIALIHATPVAMQPVAEAFDRNWPKARIHNLLEDSLSSDLENDGSLTAAMVGRFETLAAYVVEAGADGVLFTCSAFGAAIEAAARKVAPVPVLKPNEAMFEDALTRGRRIGMLATFQASVPSMAAEFEAMVAAAGADARLDCLYVPAAMEALRAGDGAQHDRLLAESAPRLDGCDAIMLAQFSTARARDAVSKTAGRPVLTSPDSAVRKLKAALTAVPAR